MKKNVIHDHKVANEQGRLDSCADDGEDNNSSRCDDQRQKRRTKKKTEKQVERGNISLRFYLINEAWTWQNIYQNIHRFALYILFVFIFERLSTVFCLLFSPRIFRHCCMFRSALFSADSYHFYCDIYSRFCFFFTFATFFIWFFFLCPLCIAGWYVRDRVSLIDKTTSEEGNGKQEI